jgi:hypothetical protein
MGLNDGYEPKQQTRAQLQQLTEDFLANGGEISRDQAGKVTVTCTACGNRRFVHLDYALSFGKRRSRCGASARIEP